MRRSASGGGSTWQLGLAPVMVAAALLATASSQGAVFQRGAWGAAGATLSHVAPIRVLTPGGTLAASKSTNWAGYDQGTLATGRTYTQISATWVVPRAIQKNRGQSESSATWVGIGGGCVDASCSLTDPTLIQAGTEQDVAANGTASYSSWWEILPVPAVTTSLAVAPGNSVSVDIVQAAPGLWSISITNESSHKSFSMMVPYASTMDTAEWIVESPIVVGTSSAGEATLPVLGVVSFASAKADGAPARLQPVQEVDLVSANGAAIATPSAPDTDADAFNVCTYAARCAAPADRPDAA